MRLPLLALLLCACASHADAPAVAARLDAVWPRLQAQYSAEQREAVSWAETPAEAWDETAKVLDEWTPAWLATVALVSALDSGASPVPAFCTARELWSQRGIGVDDGGLCTIQRPCWKRPSE